jgi:hypothetical protein
LEEGEFPPIFDPNLKFLLFLEYPDENPGPPV